MQKEYEEDFVKPKLTLAEYIQRLNLWREKYERYLDSRPRLQSLDTISHYLAEYPHGKYDDIEIPGQYTEVRPLCPTPFRDVESFRIGERAQCDVR